MNTLKSGMNSDVRVSKCLVYPSCYYEKQNGQRSYKYLVLRRNKSYYVKNTLILWNSSLKLTSQKVSRFGLTAYLSCLVDLFFNRKLTILRVSIAFLFSPAGLVIRMRSTPYRSFTRKTTRRYPDHLMSLSAVLSVNNSRFDDFVDHIYPTELAVKEYHWLLYPLIVVLLTTINCNLFMERHHSVFQN